jgi:signal transduction histidine kinase
VWGICYFIWQLQTMPEASLLWQRALLFAQVFIHSFYLHFIFSITNLIRQKIKILFLSYSTTGVFSILVFTPFFTNSAGTQKLAFEYWPDATPLVSAWIIIQIFFVLYGLFTLYSSIKTVEQHKKNQLKYLIIIFAFAWGGGLMNWLPWYNINILPVGNSFVTIYLATLAYAIIRHQLLDINIVFRKGLVYSMLVTIITVIYFIIAFLFENIFRGFVGYHSTVLTLSIIVTFIVIFQPLKNRIQYVVDKYFFKGSIDQIQQENIRLRQELERSEKLKAVATLAAGMAHEIKNPLTGIKTFTEYLPQKYQEKGFIEKFQKIVGSEVEKINNIVGQLLDFAKPKAPELKNHDIRGLLDETVEFLSNNLIKYKIAVQKDCKIKEPILPIDPIQIKQAILNIILNAIDSMKAKGGQLTITIADDKAQGMVRIDIEDTGCGIDTKNLPHLFDPFYSTKDTNAGLGLSIVYGIIEKHGGKIEVKSEVGKGTIFSIYLPKG